MFKTSTKLINTLTNIVLNWFRYIEKIINYRILPDKLYLSLLYRVKFKKKLDWKNPKTFNEKIQWLKLYYRRPECAIYVDKYKVRELRFRWKALSSLIFNIFYPPRKYYKA